MQGKLSKKLFLSGTSFLKLRSTLRKSTLMKHFLASSRPSCWIPPKQGFIMISSDAAVAHRQCRTGRGVLARNCEGKLLRAWASSQDHKGSPIIEEAEAIRMGMLMAHEANWSMVEFQSDCKRVIDMINAKEKDEASIAIILEDIRVLRNGFD